MRGVIGRLSAGAAGRILDSANARKIKNLTEGCVRCSIDEGAQVPRWKSMEPMCQRNLMRQNASSLRKDKSGYER